MERPPSPMMIDSIPETPESLRRIARQRSRDRRNVLGSPEHPKTPSIRVSRPSGEVPDVEIKRLIFTPGMSSSTSQTDPIGRAGKVGQAEQTEDMVIDPQRLSASRSTPGVPVKNIDDKATQERMVLWDKWARESGIGDWQTNHGVQWRVDRAPGTEPSQSNASKKSNLTASNVRQYHLVKEYGWYFSIDSVIKLKENTTINQGSRAILTNAQHILNAAIGQKLMIPSDWPTNVSINDTRITSRAMARWYISSLHLGHKNSRSTIDFTPIAAMKAWPRSAHVNISNWDSSAGYEGDQDIAWILLGFIVSPKHPLAGSELVVERNVGSLISRFFEVPNCETSAGQPLEVPLPLACFGSFASPDCLVRMNNIDEADSPELNILQPVIFAAEAKTLFKISGKKKSAILEGECDDMHRVSAQLAWCLQPTLKVFIGHIVQTASEGTDSAVDWSKVTVPDWLFAYGVGYDTNGFHIYAFHPMLQVSGDGKPHWKFSCVQLVSKFTAVFAQYNLYERIRAFKALLAMRQHAANVTKNLGGDVEKLKFPEEFRLFAHKLWNEGRS